MNVRNPYYKNPYYSIICDIEDGITNSSTIARNQCKAQPVINKQLKVLLCDGLIKKDFKRKKVCNAINYELTDVGLCMIHFHRKYKLYVGVFEDYDRFMKDVRISRTKFSKSNNS